MSGRSASRSRSRYLIGASVAAAAVVLSACGGSSGGGQSTSANQTITVAVVNNPQMSDIQKLTADGFEKSHPNIHVKYVTLDENTLRDQVTKDVAAGGGQFDVVMIGPYEVPTWAQNKWIVDLSSDASKDTAYDVNDLIKPIRDSLSVKGKLYAVPFYGESSFLMYRKDLLQAKGITMPAKPTWDQVAQIAGQLNDPATGMAGICLRGKTGWGENLAPLDTVVNTFGGQWYDMDWNAHLTDPAFKDAVNFYVNLVKTDGEKGAGNFSFNECANAMQQNKAAMWYDATVGASVIDAPGSPIAGKLGYAPAPVKDTANAGWLWSWALSIEGASKHQAAAWTYMSWATSKQYIDYAGSKLGWAAVPPGSRYSTYSNPNYQKAAASFAKPTLDEINSVNVKQPGTKPQPYVGVQYVGIPEFEDLGTRVSQEITSAIAGQQSVDSALNKAQGYAETVGKTYQ
ncbi:MAG TPA: sugar ABC transporter substrate-binding protein [Actinomycetes bacterium]|nr:sugar ABC transporter substrate-binding protein [Actinomycetes bacterium]